MELIATTDQLLTTIALLGIVVSFVLFILSLEYRQKVVPFDRERMAYRTKGFPGSEVRENRGGYSPGGYQGPIINYTPPSDKSVSGERALTDRSIKNGRRFLMVFVGVVSIFGVYTLYLYSPTLNKPQLVLMAWLFISMVFGMMVRVITANHQAGKPLFDVSINDLIYPLLFSVMVFYPVWCSVRGEASLSFSIYSAFLNGYFWRTIVSNAKPDKNESATSNT